METREATNRINAMTFNLRGATRGSDGVNTWSNREGLVVGLVQKHAPDFLGTQETTFGNLATYFERLREREGNKFYGELLGLDMDYGNFNPIFWRTEHYRLDSGTTKGIWLHPQETPNEVASDWGAANIRCANLAVFTEVATDKKICVVNTHLDHISDRARYEGARLIVDKLQGLADVPTIVTGDFNCGKYIPPGSENIAPYTSKAIQVFEEAGFVDVYSQCNQDGPDSNTFHGFLGDTYNPENDYGLWRIDYIFSRGLTPLACDIDRSAEPPVFPSDHNPVIASVAQK